MFKNFYKISDTGLIFIIVFALIISPIIHTSSLLYAQTGSNCEKELEEAENKYTTGHFDEALDLIRNCMKNEDISKAVEEGGLRLIGLIYIAKEHEEEAKKAVKKLLERVPDYQPDLINDPPPFVKLVEQMRSETVKNSTSKWWYIGGGVVLTAGIIYLLTSSDDSEEEPLPLPPAYPGGQ